MTKRRKTRLPRLTVLSLSAKDLQRFSDAAELVARVAHDMTGILGQLRDALAEAMAVGRSRRRPRPADPAPASAEAAETKEPGSND